MDGAKISEKREYQRLDVKGNVLLRPENDRNRLLKGSVDDLSFGGFRIRTMRCFKVDDKVEFELITEFLDSPLKGSGRIRYVENGRFGLCLAGAQFTSADSEELRDLIRNFLRKKSASRLRREKVVNELRLVAKIAPLIFFFALLAVVITSLIGSHVSVEGEHSKRLQDALVYYLYHAH